MVDLDLVINFVTLFSLNNKSSHKSFIRVATLDHSLDNLSWILRLKRGSLHCWLSILLYLIFHLCINFQKHLLELHIGPFLFFLLLCKHKETFLGKLRRDILFLAIQSSLESAT